MPRPLRARAAPPAIGALAALRAVTVVTVVTLATVATMATTASAATMATAATATPAATATTPVTPEPATGAQESTPPTAPDSAAAPGSALRVWLVTIGPGEAVWERFGHNALRILDTGTGQDLSYNWGLFDFAQADFLPRFLMGRMLYSMAPYETRAMIAAYASTGREVVLQELDLTPAERLELRRFVETNALPENRDYFYQYFLDNCSTRVRDALDAVLGGALFERFVEAPTGTTWRRHIRRLTEPDPPLFTGMDLLLGRPGDAPITVWEEMFLPMTLRDALREVVRTGPDGSPRPLVSSEELVVPGSVPPLPEEPPSWIGWYLLLGVGLGALAGGAGWWAARSVADGGRGVAGRAILGLVGGAWGLLAGVAGTLLVAVLFTDHTFMYSNANLFLFTPLSLVVAAGAVVAAIRGAPPVWSARAAWVVVGLAAIALAIDLLPRADQANGIFHALALPAHVGLAAGLTWLGVVTGWVPAPSGRQGDDP